MRAPDGPGEAPAGLLGGCKMMFFFVFLYGFHVFHLGCCCCSCGRRLVAPMRSSKQELLILHRFVDIFVRARVKATCQKEGSVRAPDGPGKPPAGQPGGHRMLCFSLVFTVFSRVRRMLSL